MNKVLYKVSGKYYRLSKLRVTFLKHLKFDQKLRNTSSALGIEHYSTCKGNCFACWQFKERVKSNLNTVFSQLIIIFNPRILYYHGYDSLQMFSNSVTSLATKVQSNVTVKQQTDPHQCTSIGKIAEKAESFIQLISGKRGSKSSKA